MPDCKHCLAADADMRAVCHGIIKALRAERAASRDPRTRNRKLRGIQKMNALLALPAPTGSCAWVAEKEARCSQG